MPREDKGYHWLKRQVDYGGTVVEREGLWEDVPDELRPEQLGELTHQEKVARCRQVLRR